MAVAHNNSIMIGKTLTIMVIISAGYYASGRRLGGIVSNFLLAVVAKDSEQSPPAPTEFRSFCRVGSGYSNKELFSLLQKLQPHFR